jgi:SAM-dependent methyltransferase
MQNIYDHPEFFAAYQEMRSQGRGLHETTVRPALPDLLPPLDGRRVLDLGCGEGWLARLAAERGAVSVVGIDPSERMLALARERTADLRITYRRAFVEDAEVPPGSVDVVLSVLALHYVADLTAAMGRVASWLAAGGTLVAVLEHPILLAPSPDTGIAETPGGRPSWLLHSYAIEGERVQEWFVEGVRKHHRTMSSIVNAVVGAGLRLDRLAEPLPAREACDEETLADARMRPYLLALRAAKAV